MEFDVVSSEEFRRLEDKVDALLVYLGLDYETCNHPDVPKPSSVTPSNFWSVSQERKRQCKLCTYNGMRIVKREV